jgi:hypothetical protein
MKPLPLIATVALLLIGKATCAQISIHTDSMTVCKTDDYGFEKCMPYMSFNGDISFKKQLLFFNKGDERRIVIVKYVDKSEANITKIGGIDYMTMEYVLCLVTNKEKYCSIEFLYPKETVEYKIIGL